MCYVKGSNEQWFCMDDESVRGSSLKQALSQQAYMLFYVRNEMPVYAAPAPEPAPAAAAERAAPQAAQDTIDRLLDDGQSSSDEEVRPARIASQLPRRSLRL